MRGVEAPFQLLVSVVGMLMVIALAYTVLSHANTQNCSRKWQAQLDNISSALSTVVEGSPPTQMIVRYDFRCGRGSKYYLRLNQYSSSTSCLRICGSSGTNGCYVLELNVIGRTKDGMGTIDVERACVQGAGSYLNLSNNGCSSDETALGELSNGDWQAMKPFGILVIRKPLGKSGIVFCRRS